ncbi:cytochrome P450 98A2-like [Pollicipes pollicipes]|uniref:cytochrome P450 98A2-like n=1 Tax=Pollicipes pollicipes TaxID=41117 RepID=UPI00188577E9|nr:cytochrome P450 98A2-like [Pollicipes pollicipes]
MHCVVRHVRRVRQVRHVHLGTDGALVRLKRGLIVAEAERWRRNSQLVTDTLQQMLDTGEVRDLFQRPLVSLFWRLVTGRRLPAAQAERLAGLLRDELAALGNPWVENRVLRRLFPERSGWAATLRFRDELRGAGWSPANDEDLVMILFDFLNGGTEPAQSLLETPHTVHGYRVPRDTVIIYGILAGHWDGTLWSQPEQFRPERFLREDGAFAAGDKFVPYGVGPRRCPGRRLADALALGVVTRLVRQFELTPPDGAPPPPEEVAVVLTRRCGPFQAHFRPR